MGHPTPPRATRQAARRRRQFNVPIDPATSRDVGLLCAVLHCTRPQLFRVVLDAFLGRRPVLSAPEHQGLEVLAHLWQEAGRRPRGPTAD